MLLRFFKNYTPKEKRLIKAVCLIVGRKPKNFELYRLATQHSSVARTDLEGFRHSNERLEYLGDAVLGSIIAEYLFKRYPYQDEGFLTEIRSRIVNRESLNRLAQKLGLNKVLEFNFKNKQSIPHKSIYGDALEALVGAVFLDRGYRFCKSFVIKRLLEPHFDLDDIIKNDQNHKSRIIEWAQKESRSVKFEIVETSGNKQNKQFTVQVLLDEEPIGVGSGFSKKKAEQAAAYKACNALDIF